jgi:ubiquinone/menaquinone biosynthesis C-methylase UbiE
MGEQSGWQLTGSAPETYEQVLVPAFMTHSQQLVALAALQRGERVLDVACGTGIVARLATQMVGTAGKVVAVDVNEGMLSMARTVPQQHDGPPIEWRQSDAAALPFPDAAFDVVFCQYGLEFFADRAAGLREVARVLVPGGRLVLRVWRALERQPFYVALYEALERHVRAGVGASLLKAFSLADAAELRALVAGAGFREVHLRITTNPIRYPSLEEYVLRYLHVYLSVAGDVTAMDDTARKTALLRDVTTALRADVDDDGLATPTESHVVVAHT